MFNNIKNKDYWTFAWDVTGDIAIIILTIVLVKILLDTLGGDPVQNSIKDLNLTLSDLRRSTKLLEDSKKTGLDRIYSQSGSFGTHETWMSLLTSINEKADIMGFSLLVWSKGNNFEEELVNLVQKGKHIRILTMDSDNKDLSALMNFDQIKALSEERIESEIKNFGVLMSEVQSKISNLNNVKGSFEYRTLKNGLIVSQVSIFDNVLLMNQYLYSCVASLSPLMKIEGRNTGLFKVYSNEFERIWELAEKNTP